SGRLSRAPQRAFFSSAVSAPSASIQPILPLPRTNSRSMIAQQQPTQNQPWSSPSDSASRYGLGPRQCSAIKPYGARHRARKRYFSRLNLKETGDRQDQRAYDPAVQRQPGGAPGQFVQCRVGEMRGNAEAGPDGEIAADQQCH